MRWYTELQKAWSKHPPADWFIASYFKYRPPAEVRQVEAGNSDPNGMDRLLARFGLVPGQSGTTTIQ